MNYNERISEENTVSIITPVYNAEKYVALSIESVLKQSYSNWELILIDDCSTDSSLDILELYAMENTRIKLIKLEHNSGVSAARNKGVSAATGRFIAFLDADDIWLPRKLELQIEAMCKNNISLCFSSYYTIDHNGKRNGLRIPPKTTTYKKMLFTNHIGNLTAIYDTAFYGKVYFSNIHHEDYLYWLSILKDNTHAVSIKEPLAEYRVFSSSLSGNKKKVVMWTWNIYKKINLPFYKRIIYFSAYFINSILKRVAAKVSYTVFKTR